MKLLSILVMILTLGLTTLTMNDAEAAKRLGGGKSTGMQRENTSQPANTATAAGAGAAGAAAAAAPKRSWMGPLAGLAAGLGLAALASYLGFGEELATALMIGLAVMLVMAVVGYFMMRKRMAQAGQSGVGGMQYAGAGAGMGGAQGQTPARPYDWAMPAGGAAAGAAGSSMIGSHLNGGTSRIPADFDAIGFANTAKGQFIRLQAAYDSANVQDIRDFTTPEMFADIRADLESRGPATSTNEVVSVDAQVVDVSEEAQRYIVSVRFNGVLRDSRTREDERFDEVWHLTKPREGQGGWLLSGIQQLS
jgi:predicted lipid-binding transport protein (Tim44 family)